MIVINNLSKNYGKKILFSNLNLTINPKEKIGLIGPNGAGKSTFFGLLLGDVEPSSGTVQVAKNSRSGISRRRRISTRADGPQRDHRRRPHDHGAEAGEGGPGEPRTGGIQPLRRGPSPARGPGISSSSTRPKRFYGLGFKERDLDRPILNLSGGWQMRTLLAKLLTVHYDLILLDEPTNYLDLNAAIWLKDYLSGFNGTFLMISHDKDFLTDVTIIR
jgi:ATP-binding cassette subfamily F protein 3